MSESPAAIGAAARSPRSERTVDVACVVFALWTLASHAAAFTGGSLWWVLSGFAGLGVVTLGGWLLPWGRAAGPFPEPEAPATDSGRERLRLAGAGLGLAGGLLLQGHPLALWWWSVVLLAAAGWIFCRSPAAREDAAGSRGHESLLWGLALLCVLVALVSHRTDIDDAFYVNLAVAAADNPGQPVLAGDTLHGVPGLPLHMAVYRLHAWELWNAALSRLTGLPAIACFHLVSTVLVAGLAPLALARLLRSLSPRFWLWAVAATVFVLLTSADTHRWYGNFGFVRIWQGKAVFLMVFLPLVQAYAIAFARRPSLRGFLLLAAGQIAALGATSSALWAAPVAALAAAACAVPFSRRGLRRMAGVLLSSLYLLGAGVVVKAELEAERSARSVSAVVEEPSAEPSAEEQRERAERFLPGRQLGGALEAVAGNGPLRTVAWIALLVAWAALPVGPGRRFAIAVPLVVGLTVLNPYLSELVSRHVVGPSYWRSLWALPIPILMGLLLTAPLEWAGPRRSWGIAGAVTAGLLFALLVPKQATLSEANAVELRSPGLKVPTEAYALAERFAAVAEPGAFVVAPVPVSVWLPTFHDRAFPLVVRDIYLRPYRARLGDKDLRWRVLMGLYAEGRVDEASVPAWFREGLEHFDVQAVFLWVTPESGRARRILERHGFRVEQKDPEWEIWVRS